MKYYLAAQTTQNLRTYMSWFEQRGVSTPPAVSRSCIFIQSEHGDLVAGAMIFPSEGSHMLIEHLAVHPEAPAAQAHEVVTFMAKAALGAGAMMSKVPLILAKKSLTGILQRAGYAHQDLTVFTAFPGQLPEKTAPAVEGTPPGPEGISEENTSNVPTGDPPVKKKRSRKKPGVKKASKRSKRAEDVFDED